jgi:dienelactone hydrolase
MRLPVAALVVWSAAAHALPPPAPVTFPSLDKDVTVSALYFRPPQAAADARVPLIVAVHGCGGMWSASPSRRDELSERSIAWTEQLLADGYAVLWPDSFTPRGRRSVCLVKRGEPTITPVTRRLDVLGAVVFAVAQPGVDGSRIALLGWSHGGSTTLAAINGKDPEVARFFAAPGAPPAVRAAVTFYPGCGVSLRMGDGWLPTPPLAIHIGALDDWSNPQLCLKLADAARARGADVALTVYPGAYHDFDVPRGTVKTWKEVTSGTHPDQGVHLGPDPAARAAAVAAVRDFLREKLKESKP